MAISERERLKLYNKLGETLGSEFAGTMMELLPPTGWDDIATKDEVRSSGAALRGEMAELRGEMGGLRGEMGELRGEMGELRGEMGGLRGEMAEFRAEVRTDIATLEVGMAQQFVSLQRNLLLTIGGFMLSIWLTLLLAN